MPSLQVHPTRKSPRKHLKDVVDTVGSLDIKQLIVPTRKATKKGPENEKPAQEKAEYQRGLQRQRTNRYVQN